MELILHIGHEKTGTTSIQESLVQNTNYLQSLNIHIPTEFGIGNARSIPATFSSFIDHYFERRGITEGDLKVVQKEFKKDFDVYFKKLPQDTKLILSSEHLASRLTSSESVSELANFLNKYFEKITIIIFLRDQAGMAQSSYWELLKSGSQESILYEPSKEIIYDPYFNYQLLLENWLSGFQKKQIQIYNYNYVSSNYPSLIDFFYSVISNIFNVKIDFSLIIKSREANQSPDSFYLEILRLINQRIISENPTSVIKPYLDGNSLRKISVDAIRNIAGNKSKIEVNQEAWQLAFQSSNNWVEENFAVFGEGFTKFDELFKPETSDSQKSNGSEINFAYEKFIDFIFSFYSASKTELDQTKTELDLIMNSRIWRVTKIWRDLNSIDLFRGRGK